MTRIDPKRSTHEPTHLKDDDGEDEQQRHLDDEDEELRRDVGDHALDRLQTCRNTRLEFIYVKVNVKEVLTCTFRVSCYSTRLSWAHTPVINWAVCLGQKVTS